LHEIIRIEEYDGDVNPVLRVDDVFLLLQLLHDY